MQSIESDTCKDVLILSGDQLYRMNYRRMIETHRSNNADVTIAVHPVRRDECHQYGIVRTDESTSVRHIEEKPTTDEQCAPLRTPAAWLQRHGAESRGREYLANMGIYLFRREVLFDLFAKDPQAA